MTEKMIIETIDVKKIYGMGDIQVHALNGLTIKITQGEFVSIMGPSGSGKSTLMNILGCLDRPTEGRYILDGEDVSELSRESLAHVRNRKLGFIFQAYNLLPRMNALENVMLPLMYAQKNNTTDKERQDKAEELMGLVGLQDRMHHLPKELSGGQQQRVAIARSIINDPVMILADEPTGNLDTKSSREIMSVLHKMHESGRTIVMVTHEPGIANETERIIHVRDGKLDADYKNGKNNHITKSKFSDVEPNDKKEEQAGGK